MLTIFQDWYQVTCDKKNFLKTWWRSSSKMLCFFDSKLQAGRKLKASEKRGKMSQNFLRALNWKSRKLKSFSINLTSDWDCLKLRFLILRCVQITNIETYSPVKCARKWTKLNGPRKCRLYFMVCKLITKNFKFKTKKDSVTALSSYWQRFLRSSDRTAALLGFLPPCETKLPSKCLSGDESCLSVMLILCKTRELI